MKLLSYFSITAFLLLTSSHCRRANVYYVKEPDGTGCPTNTTCHELAFYTNQSDLYFTNDTIIYFLEGTHVLEENELVIIRETSNLTLQGIGNMEEGSHETVMESPSVVSCANNVGGILILNGSGIEIKNLTIKDCGANLPNETVHELTNIGDALNKYDWSAYTMALVLFRTLDVKIEHVSIQNSTGYGLFAINAFNTRVWHSSFAYNNLVNFNNCESSQCIGGNALFVYTIMISECDEMPAVYQLDITNSNFSFGFDNSSFSLISASGLAVYMEQIDAFGINVLIDSVVLYGNSGINSCNFRYVITTSVVYHFLSIRNTLSIYANEINTMNSDQRIIGGSGFKIFLGIYTKNNDKRCSNNSLLIPPKTTVSITNIRSLHNKGTYGTGLFVYCDHPAEGHNIVINSSQFNNNSGFAGAGLFLAQGNGQTYEFILIDTTVTNSRQFHPSSDDGPESINSVILVRRVLNVRFMNLHVINNTMTGLVLLNARAFFKGNHTVFINNSAQNGGGLKAYGDSTMVLENPVEIKFINNTAVERGGAIYVNVVPFVKTPCFYQPHDPTLNKNAFFDVGFVGNTAGRAGTVLYGVNVESCYLSYPSMFDNGIKKSVQGVAAFDSIFDYETQEGISLVSSEPEAICFCFDQVPNCSVNFLNYSLLPGETQTVSIVTVGVRYGSSPGVVTLEERVVSTGNILHTSLESTDMQCTNITFMAEPDETLTVPSERIINLFIHDTEFLVRNIYFDIKPCPPGFELSYETWTCDCSTQIVNLNRNVTCHAQSNTIAHEGQIWIGYENSTECLLTSDKCTADYCATRSVNFTLQNQDKQCALDRSGILCGQCAEGLSLMLGSNKCGDCNNSYISLIIPFALAGIALVVFLICLNLTVSVGTINGLIFYANIIKINESSFFPNGPVPILSQFISWLNLDLGISICFSKELDAYSKTWLQFVFPFYLWIVMIVIIILSHYFFRISKLMGRQAVPVLATLLLLSFTKLFRTCILALQVAYITCGDSTLSVWAIDANVKYWSTKHLPLVIFALVVFVFLMIPYTLLLLFSPLLERYFSRFKCCKSWIKFKPLFDAYNGPYKDKYRFWTGLLLLIRLVLVVVSTNSSNHVYTSLTIIIISTIILSVIALSSGLYQHRCLDVLECWFLFNIITIAAANIDNNVIVQLSISLSLVVFFGILVYHTLVRLKLIEVLQAKFKEIRARKLDHQPIPQTTVFTNKSPNVQTITIGLDGGGGYLEDSVVVQNKRETLLRDFNSNHYALMDD